MDAAFDELIVRLREPLTLAYPNSDKAFIAKAEASSFAVGAFEL